MPELPEVETVRKGLEPAFAGQRIRKLELRRRDLRTPFPKRFRQRLEGARLETLTRRAKYLLGHLDTGETLIMHLGMTGRFTILEADGANVQPGAFYEPGVTDATGKGPHDHVVFHLENGTRIVYSDPRRFGTMDLATKGKGEDHPLLKNLGVEPLGNALNAHDLARRFRTLGAPLKATLLNQCIIAGLGNIYVCEALYRARLSPRRKTKTLARHGRPDPRLDHLVRHIRDVLNDAIAAGGSSLQDYRAADGALGAFQHRFQVYDREGKACLTRDCGGTIRRIVQGARSTFYCPRCQR